MNRYCTWSCRNIHEQILHLIVPMNKTTLRVIRRLWGWGVQHLTTSTEHRYHIEQHKQVNEIQSKQKMNFDKTKLKTNWKWHRIGITCLVQFYAFSIYYWGTHPLRAPKVVLNNRFVISHNDLRIDQWNYTLCYLQFWFQHQIELMIMFLEES